MKKHFITFYSPGTMVPEESTREVDAWSVDLGCALAHDIVERHNATPYAFRFSTRSRGPEDLDSTVTALSPLYYLGGTIQTYDEIVARNDPQENILRSNMRINEIKRVLVNINSWRHIAALKDDDVVLDWKPKEKTNGT